MKHERDAFRRVVRWTLARSPDSEGSGFDPTVSQIAHPFATPPLLIDRPHGQPKTDILGIPVRARIARRVRAIVTRSAGGPAYVLRRKRDRRTKDAYDRLLPIPSNQSGTLIGAVSACPPAPLRGGSTGADGGSRRRCALRWTRLSLGTGVFFPPSRADSSHV
jgi:hypothetical protein